MRDLGSRAAMRVGSSPFRRTTSEQSPLCSDVLLFLWNKRTSSARFLAPPFQLRPTLLGSQLVGRPADGFFVSDGNIGFNRPLQIVIIRTRFQSGTASGFYLGEKQKRRYHECPSLFLYDPFLLSGSLALCPFHFSSFPFLGAKLFAIELHFLSWFLVS